MIYGLDWYFLVFLSHCIRVSLDDDHSHWCPGAVISNGPDSRPTVLGMGDQGLWGKKSPNWCVVGGLTLRHQNHRLSVPGGPVCIGLVTSQLLSRIHWNPVAHCTSWPNACPAFRKEFQCSDPRTSAKNISKPCSIVQFELWPKKWRCCPLELLAT